MPSPTKIITNAMLGGSNAPGVFAKSSDGFYLGWIDTLGNVWVAKYSTNYQLLQAQIIAVAGVDNHDVPSISVLPSGKILAVYSLHASTQSALVSSNVGDVRSWGAPTTVTPSGTGATFQFLFLAADTSTTTFLFTSIGTPLTWGYYTTTNGTSWSSYNTVINAGNTPIVCQVKDPGNANKIHWFVGSNLGVGKIYYFLQVIQSNASSLWYKDPGAATQITTYGSGGTDLAPAWTDYTQFTAVYTSAFNAVPFSAVCPTAGTPAVLYAVNTASGSNSTAIFTFYRALWNGSSFTTTTIAGADSAANSESPFFAGPDYLAHGSNICGYPCLDPNSVDIAYVPVAYASNYSPALPSQETSGGLTNLRLEQMTFGGSTWTKTADITGDVSTLGGIMSMAVPGVSPTQLFYVQGTYVSFTSFSPMDLWAYPALSLFAAKPSSPVYTSGVAPLATQAFYLLHSASAAAAASIIDITGVYNGSVTGGLTVGSDTYGKNLSAFDSTHYGSLSGAFATAWSNGAYPKWFAWMGSVPSGSTTVSLTPFLFARSTDTTHSWGMLLNSSAAGQVNVFVNGNNNVATTSKANDGAVHVWLLIASDSSHTRLYCDKDLLVTSTNSLTTLNGNLDMLTLGAFKRQTTVSGPMTGGVINIASGGWNGAPEPGYLYEDWISGQFGGSRGSLATKMIPLHLFFQAACGQGVA